jgi:hypothetical protein
VACPALQYFSTVSHKWQKFRKTEKDIASKSSLTIPSNFLCIWSELDSWMPEKNLNIVVEID